VFVYRRVIKMNHEHTRTYTNNGIRLSWASNYLPVTAFEHLSS